MDETLKKLVVKLLKEKTHDIEVGNCVLTADEAMSIMGAQEKDSLRILLGK